MLKPIKQKGLMNDAILLAKLQEKRLELTVSDEKQTLNILNERRFINTYRIEVRA